MAVEASFVTTGGEFPLAEVFSKFPAAQIELDRVVPTDEVIVPYFWLRDVDSSQVGMRGIEHPGIDDLRIIDDVDGEVLVRIDWDFDHESILTAIVETDVFLVSAIGQENRWTFDLRGEDQQAVSAFQSYCLDNGIPVELVQLHALSPLHADGGIDLTKAQRDALTLAYARGYYDTPREATQEDIAEELGISRQALASRLRRGTRRLITRSVIGPAD